MGISEKLLFIGFILIGALIVFLGVTLQKNNSEFFETAQYTKGIITDIDIYTDSDGDTNHSAYAEFNVNNQTYSGQLSIYDSSMFVGKEIDIFYNPNNPNDFKGSSSKYFGYFVIFFGSIFSLVGFVTLINQFKHSRELKRYEKTEL